MYSKSPDAIALVRDRILKEIGLSPGDEWIRQAVEVLADSALGGDLSADLRTHESPEMDSDLSFRSLLALWGVLSKVKAEPTG